MSCSRTILRGLAGLVVALLLTLVGSQGDAWLGAARVAVTANQIAAAQTAPSPAPRTALSARAKTVSGRPSMLDLLVVSELACELADEVELEDRREGSSASVLPSIRIELQLRSKGAVRSRSADPSSVLSSHRMPTGHPRGPPAARLG